MTRRKKPTEREIVAIVARQMEVRLAGWEGQFAHPFIVCPICDMPIRSEDISSIERDHDDAIGFGEGRDTPENCRYVHGHCHRRKTAQDKARMAKADRQGGKTGQQKRRKMRKILDEQQGRVRLPPRKQWPEGRKLASRPMRRRT